MPTKTIKVYTDHKSPYAFVALAESWRLDEDYDVELDWYPYRLAIAGYLGSLDDRTEHQWRRVRYSYMDARRLANEQGLTVKGPKIIYDGTIGCAGMLFAKKLGRLREFNDIVFARFWRHELSIDSMDDVRSVIEQVGGDGAAFEAYADGPGREDLLDLRAKAEADGVFGVPMFDLDGELFWGGDRIPHLRRKLDRMGLRKTEGLPRGPAGQAG